MNHRTENQTVYTSVATQAYEMGIGAHLEDAVMDGLMIESDSTYSSEAAFSLGTEVAPNHAIKNWLVTARVSFLREMTYGILSAAIQSYDSADWDSLGQAVVDWTSTLELEADRPSIRRMERRKRRS